MIPKIIHYIHFGKEKNKLTQLCLNSAKRVCNDYEIKEWNESNVFDLPVSKTPFFQECYRLKLWAFLSDIVRISVLYEYGGIYIDTDVEVLKKFDFVLQYEMFLCREGDFYCTAVIGCEPKSKMMKRIVDFYESDIMHERVLNNPIIFKKIIDSNEECFKNLIILKEDVFSPYKGKECKEIIGTDDTIAIHWFSGDWNISLKGYLFCSTLHVSNPIIKFFIKIKKFFGYLIHK